jgi:hypothetical protein
VRGAARSKSETPGRQDWRHGVSFSGVTFAINDRDHDDDHDHDHDHE